MIHVNGHDIDFDITAPDVLRRYLAACDALDEAGRNAPNAPDVDTLGTLDGLRAYEQYITGQCRLLTDFIDAAFGDGTCNVLLGEKTSLDTLIDVCDDLREAVSAQGAKTGAKISAYRPNRSVRDVMV